MKESHRDAAQLPFATANCSFADVAQQHIRLGHLREWLAKRPRNRILYETFSEADAQIARQQLDEVFCFQRCGPAEGGNQEPLFVQGPTRFAEACEERLGLNQRNSGWDVRSPDFADDFSGNFASVAEAHITRT